MISILVSTDTALRLKRRTSLEKAHPHAIVLDDASITADVLRAHAYPSLFEEGASVVIVSFALETIELTKQLLETLSASPTQFFFLERSLAADAKKLLSKYGSVEILDAKVTKKAPSLFYDASAVVLESNKLKRWQKLQTLLQSEVPEAFIGILYWKLRDMAVKGNASSKTMYDALITAHSEAWINGTPLSNAIEKVLLTH
jgi:hypothetical protein